MDPASINLVMLGLIQAAKLATQLAEQVGTEEISPDEAKARWRAQANEWTAAKDAWFSTPDPNDGEVGIL